MYSGSRGIRYTAPPGPDEPNDDADADTPSEPSEDVSAAPSADADGGAAADD